MTVLSACERSEGPAEEAEAKVGDKLQETQEQFQETTQATGGKLEETGDEPREGTSR